MTRPVPFRVAALLGAFAGLATAGVALALSWSLRCIDSAVIYYPPALVWAGIGVALLTFGGATLLARAPRLGAATLVTGVAGLSVALAGPPFRTCTDFVIGR